MGSTCFTAFSKCWVAASTGLYVVGIYNLTDDLDASECSILSDFLARWWERSILRFQAEALWLLGATDDLVLDSETVEIVPLI